MKIMFFGLGSIGQKHLGLLQENYDHDIYAFRSTRKKKSLPGVKDIFTWKEVDQIEPDVAFITNPTHKHIRTALSCAKRKIRLFIEKPIGHNLNLLDALLEECRDIPTYVAYPFRHDHTIRWLEEKIKTELVYHARLVCSTYLPNWRPYQTYSSYTKKGGGALLDLSHEIDLAVYLLGEIGLMEGFFGKNSDVTVDAEDHADIIIQHDYGILSNIHLDLYSPRQQRYIEVQTENKKRKINLNTNDQMYVEQLQYFFENIDNPRMMNNIHEASKMFKKLIEFKEG